MAVNAGAFVVRIVWQDLGDSGGSTFARNVDVNFMCRRDSFGGQEDEGEALRYPVAITAWTDKTRDLAGEVNGFSALAVGIPGFHLEGGASPLRRMFEAGKSRVAVNEVPLVRFEELRDPGHYTIRGLDRMKARVNLALVVMMALAHASVEERQPHLMRSLVRTGTLPDTS